jgi:hypothetical protein
MFGSKVIRQATKVIRQATCRNLVEVTQMFFHILKVQSSGVFDADFRRPESNIGPSKINSKAKNWKV